MAASSLVICCFLWITLHHFFPQALATRILAYDPQYTEDPNPTGNEEDDGRHKIGVGGSTSRPAGSATGSSPPAAIQISPPTSATEIGYGHYSANGTNVTTKSTATGSPSTASGSMVTRATSSDHSSIHTSSSASATATTNGSSTVTTSGTTVIARPDGKTITVGPTTSAIGGEPPEQWPYPMPPPQGP